MESANGKSSVCIKCKYLKKILICNFTQTGKYVTIQLSPIALTHALTHALTQEWKYKSQLFAVSKDWV